MIAQKLLGKLRLKFTMKKARQRKQNKAQIIKILMSAEFKTYAQQTLLDMPLELVEEIVSKLVQHVRQGMADKWVGIIINSRQFRIGYESDGNCYTMLVFNKVGYYYNFSNGNACTPVQCVPSLPSRIIVE